MVRGEQGRQVAGLRGLAETSTQLRYPWPLPEDGEPPEEARPDAPRGADLPSREGRGAEAAGAYPTRWSEPAIRLSALSWRGARPRASRDRAQAALSTTLSALCSPAAPKTS